MKENKGNKVFEDIKSQLYEVIAEDRVVSNAPMYKYTSFKAGGNAAALVSAETEEELKGVLQILSETQAEFIILGSGSNILVKDSGYSGIVIKLGEGFQQLDIKGEILTAGAGAKLSVVARTAMEKGLSGMEFACGIPGSIGGGVFMNAGAYGGEIKDILLSVRAMRRDGSKSWELSGDSLKLAYRQSCFQETGDIVLSARLRLSMGNKPEIEAEMKRLMGQRNKKQPVQLPSAGSFFKRPEGHFAGRLIEEAGLKGLSVGKAQVSPLHAGFIVNNGGATATDILQLMALIQSTVYERFGVKLEPEVRILGD